MIHPSEWKDPSKSDALFAPVKCTSFAAVLLARLAECVKREITLNILVLLSVRSRRWCCNTSRMRFFFSLFFLIFFPFFVIFFFFFRDT